MVCHAVGALPQIVIARRIVAPSCHYDGLGKLLFFLSAGYVYLNGNLACHSSKGWNFRIMFRGLGKIRINDGGKDIGYAVVIRIWIGIGFSLLIYKEDGFI